MSRVTKLRIKPMKILAALTLVAVVLLVVFQRQQPDDHKPATRDHAHPAKQTSEADPPTIAPAKTESEGEADRAHDETRFAGLQMARSEGLNSLKSIYQGYGGREWDAAMTSAISYLKKNGTPSLEIVKLIGQFPPGNVKEKWIRQALNALPGVQYQIRDLQSTLNSLDFPEDRKSFCAGLIPNMEISTAQQLGEFVDILRSPSTGLGSETGKFLEKETIKYFAGDVFNKGTWRDPGLWRALPPFALNEVASEVSAGLGSTKPEDLEGFLNTLPISAQPQAARAGLELLGGRNPSWGAKNIMSLPAGIISQAVTGFTEGWVRQDSVAASGWANALAQPTLKSAAARAIVNHLESRGGDPQEISAWRAIIVD